MNYKVTLDGVIIDTFLTYKEAHHFVFLLYVQDFKDGTFECGCYKIENL